MATSIIRIAIILALAAAAAFGILSEPAASPSWLSNFLLSKAAGAALAFAAWRLYRRWQSDPLIRKYEDWCRRTADADIELD